MAENKNAQLRYLTYDRLFQNPYKKHSVESILAEMEVVMQAQGGKGISQTQFHNDINFMKRLDAYNAPIERYREGAKNYYRYTDANFSIFDKSAPLNAADAALLKSGIDILQQFAGLPQLDFLENEQFLSRLNAVVQPQDSEKGLLFFEDNVDYSGRKWLVKLLQYAHNQQVIAITYKEFRQGQPQIWRISPAHLRQYNARWFLFGALHDERAVQNPTIQRVPLDRVVAVEMLPEPFRALAVDWAAYFYDIVGTIRPKDKIAEIVHLRFDAVIADYVLTKPLHPSQKQYKNADGTLDIKLKIIINWELDSLLFRYNENVEVLAPAHYRAHIAGRVRAAAAKYLD